MPYGFSKRLGGDSPENDAILERRVAGIQRSGQPKVNAIRISKASLAKQLSGKKKKAKR